MLFNLDGVEIKDIPRSRRRDFAAWVQSLSPADYQAVADAISQHADTRDVFVSSHIPGKDWTGTVYESLYHACRLEQDHAAFFFGLIVWKTMIDREDGWYFKPSDRDGRPRPPQAGGRRPDDERDHVPRHPRTGPARGAGRHVPDSARLPGRTDRLEGALLRPLGFRALEMWSICGDHIIAVSDN